MTKIYFFSFILKEKNINIKKGFTGGFAAILQCKSILQILTSCVKSSLSSASYLMKNFNFSYKPLSFLVNKRSTSGNFENDIRTHFIRFALSFVNSKEPSIIQEAMNVRYILPAIFNQLANDEPALLIEFISSLYQNILLNNSIARKAKTAFFGGYFLDQMANIYKDKAKLSTKLEKLLENFLPDLCCSPTCGISFNDPNWHSFRPSGSSIRNKSLLRFILLLQPNKELSHQKLVLKILFSAPDIISNYLRNLNYAFEPRNSVRWFQNITFLAKIISLPPPPFIAINSNQSSQLHPINVKFLLKNTLPSVLTRGLLSQGLQNDSKLIKFQIVAILLIIFDKISTVITNYEEFIQSNKRKDLLISDEIKLNWENSPEEFLREIRKQLPDFQVIVAIYRNLSNLNDSNDENNYLILYERLLKLIYYYNKYFPESLIEANFDLLKLIPKNFQSLPECIQHRLLQILRSSDLKWSSKSSFFLSIYSLNK